MTIDRLVIHADPPPPWDLIHLNACPGEKVGDEGGNRESMVAHFVTSIHDKRMKRRRMLKSR